MILIDGKASVRIDPLDRGFTYGDGVFRTMRNRDARPLHWPLHYAKLLDDCGRLGIVCPPADALLSDLLQIAAAFPVGVSKIIVTRGTGGRGYVVPDRPISTRVVYGFPLPGGVDERARTGVQATWCRTQVTQNASLAGIKHLNRLDSVLARSEWTSPDIAEGLLLDRDRNVIEGTMSNVFILKGNRLVTPSLEEAGVCGVQRERLRRLSARAGLTCSEERVSVTRLLDSDAVFLSNSVIGLWWIARLGDRRWPHLHVTKELQTLIDGADDA